MTGAILIYGAYGYTGRLIVEQAVGQGMRPVLAGRDGARLNRLADRYDLDRVCFDAADEAAVRQALAGRSVLLNCAGPFIQTYAPLTRACLDQRVHYLDITGELDVLAGCAALDAQAADAQITILPGVGFDVVPTDCVAAMLKQRLPDAMALTLAFTGMTQASRGTATTAIPFMGRLPFIRRDGKVIPRTGAQTIEVNFGAGPDTVHAISWGDVVTAAHTTGIENIEVFMKLPADMAALVKLPLVLRKLLVSPVGRPLLNRQLRAMPPGPDAEARAKGRCIVYGRASNAKGQSVELRLNTIEGYALTAVLATKIAGMAAKGMLPTGFQTPAKALGAEFILSVEGCTLID